MADDGKEFAHESLQDRASIVRYLTALGEGIQQGKLLLASDGDQFVLQPPALVKFDVRAKQKRTRAEIVLKLSWKDHPRKGRPLRVESLDADADTET
ncbi:MAG: amphi-Trp domain-containing protein [Phycisphaerae bacterium]|nr:amphi-Trp domain-containing protein [Phycisphaerae bacterium]